MATSNNSWPPNPQSKAGGRLASSLRTAEQAIAELVREASTFSAKIEGDPSLPASYTTVQVDYGFGSNDIAMAARNELLAGLGRLDSLGDAGNTVGTQTQTALAQMFTRLR